MPDFFYAALDVALDAALLVPTTVAGLFFLAVMIGGFFCRHRWRVYWLNLLIALDQLVNTLCGGAPDETISSACYRFGARIPPKSGLWWCAYKGVNRLFFWQRDHCRDAYNSERDRKHLPLEFQQQGVGHAESRDA